MAFRGRPGGVARRSALAPRAVLRAVVLSILMIVAAGGASARAAVAYRGSMCGSSAGSTLDVARVAAAQPGDVYLVTVTASAEDWDVIYEPLNTGWAWAWTGSAYNGLLMASFWRRATAADPPTWSFEMGYGTATSMAYAESVFSGADPVNDPLVAMDQTFGEAAALTHTVPDSTAAYDGMVRVVAGGARGVVSQSVSAGTEFCDEQVAGASLVGAYESVATGTTPTRTVTHASSVDAILHSFLIRPACSAGGFSLASPTTISFPSAALTGLDGSTSTSISVGVDDQRSVPDGWRVTASATQFTSGGGDTLPGTAAKITGGSAAPDTGQCAAPTNAVTYPVTLSGAATTVFNAAGSSGQGPSTLSLATRLDYPASARIGSYTSTWTFSFVSGP